jgi:foldase protein PrsA
MTTSLLRDMRTALAGLLVGSALLAAGCGSGGGSAASPTGAAAPSGTQVATVNGEAIDQKELDVELNRLYGPEVLQTLIDDRLIMQEAKKDKIALDDKEVSEQLDQLKKTPQYTAMLKAKNMTDADVEKYVRRLMELKKLILIEIPDSEKMKMYDQYKEQLEQAHIYDILVNKKEDADKIVAQLKGGANFEQLARENSQDESSKNAGGDLGWVPRAAPLDPAFAKLAFTIPLNQIAGPVQTKSGYAILKVTGRKKTYDELKSDIEDRLVQMRQGEYMQRLRVKADIKTKFDQNKAAASGVPAPSSSGSPAAK